MRLDRAPLRVSEADGAATQARLAGELPRRAWGTPGAVVRPRRGGCGHLSTVGRMRGRQGGEVTGVKAALGVRPALVGWVVGLASDHGVVRDGPATASRLLDADGGPATMWVAPTPSSRAGPTPTGDRSTSPTTSAPLQLVMAGLSSGDAQAARELRAELLAVVDRHELAADGLLGRQLHTCRARWPCSTRSKGHGCRETTDPNASRCRVDLGRGRVGIARRPGPIRGQAVIEGQEPRQYRLVSWLTGWW